MKQKNYLKVERHRVRLVELTCRKAGWNDYSEMEYKARFIRAFCYQKSRFSRYATKRRVPMRM
jgi:hypothetical protein